MGPRTPGLHKLGPWKTSERREKRDAWWNEGKGGEGVWSTGSFSIPMEQKVNDGAIVVRKLAGGEVLQGITACASEQ